MTTDIMITLITMSGGIIVALIGNILSNHYLKNKLDNEMKNVHKSIDRLTTRVDKHNGYSEKFAEMGADMKVISVQMEDTKDLLKITTLRIDSLIGQKEDDKIDKLEAEV